MIETIRFSGHLNIIDGLQPVSELKHFSLRLCVNPQLLLILSIKRIACSRKGAKIRDKLAKRVSCSWWKFQHSQPCQMARVVGGEYAYKTVRT